MISAPFILTSLILLLLYLAGRLLEKKHIRFSFFRELFFGLLFLSLLFVANEACSPYVYQVPSLASGRFNLMPFRTIRSMFQWRDSLSHFFFVSNILGNALLFTPLGLLAPLLMKRARSWWKLMMAALAFSFTIEVIQLFLPGHAFDVDDLILNTISVLPGYWFYLILMRLPRLRAAREAGQDKGQDSLLRLYTRWTASLIAAILISLVVVSFNT